ncbi:hypothetical protein AMTR_s00072p00107250 [Amborella trichopoda]|uniref:Uncharacterized protein n=1 Tax=Amborella trichopoda TaxID=13333 RepID=W1NUT2_AMBTC|nr:hypothetical protein AMTR_s00072p00107250 [Amborella trichopoda]
MRYRVGWKGVETILFLGSITPFGAFRLWSLGPGGELAHCSGQSWLSPLFDQQRGSSIRLSQIRVIRKVLAFGTITNGIRDPNETHGGFEGLRPLANHLGVGHNSSVGNAKRVPASFSNQIQGFDSLCSDIQDTEIGGKALKGIYHCLGHASLFS